MSKNDTKRRYANKKQDKKSTDINFIKGKFIYKGKSDKIKKYVDCVNTYFPKDWAYQEVKNWKNSSATVVTHKQTHTILSKVIYAPLPTTSLRVCVILHEISHILNGDYAERTIKKMSAGKWFTDRALFLKELRATEKAMRIMKKHNISIDYKAKKNMIVALFEYLEEHYRENVCN